jgi:hypothetical protein
MIKRRKVSEFRSIFWIWVGLRCPTDKNIIFGDFGLYLALSSPQQPLKCTTRGHRWPRYITGGLYSTPKCAKTHTGRFRSTCGAKIGVFRSKNHQNSKIWGIFMLASANPHA